MVYPPHCTSEKTEESKYIVQDKFWNPRKIVWLKIFTDNIQAVMQLIKGVSSSFTLYFAIYCSDIAIEKRRITTWTKE